MILTEDYKEFIQIKITSGPNQGTKTIMSLPKMGVLWNVKLRDNVGIFTGLPKGQIAEGAEKDIRRISAAATA